MAFLVLSHHQPSQLVRLLRRLRADLPGCTVLLRHDASNCDLGQWLGPDMSYVIRVGNGSPLRWGDWSIVAGVMDALDWADRHLSFDWITCLSGQDYPTTHLSQLEHTLRETELDGFLSAWPLDAHPRWAESVRNTRYHFRWYQIPTHVKAVPLRGVANRLATYAVRAVNKVAGTRALAIAPYPRALPYRVGYRRRRTPFGASRPCVVGDQWWTLRRHATSVLLREYRMNRSLTDYFKRTVVPDEAYFHTVLGPGSGVRLGPSQVLVDWTRIDSPHIYRTEDYDDIVQSDCAFVRKVDASIDAKLLDLLDERAESRSAVVDG